MFIKTGGKVKIVPAVARAIDGEIFHQAYDVKSIQAIDEDLLFLHSQ